jgi:hypothetical protein
MDAQHNDDCDRLEVLDQLLYRYPHDQDLLDEIEDIEYRLSHYEAKREDFLKRGHRDFFTARPLPVNMSAAEREEPLFSIATPILFVDRTAIKRTRIAFLTRVISDLTVQHTANDLPGRTSAAAAAEELLQITSAEHKPILKHLKFQLSKEGLKDRWQQRVQAAYDDLAACNQEMQQLKVQKRWREHKALKPRLDHLGAIIASMKSHKACMDDDEFSSNPAWVADTQAKIVHHTRAVADAEYVKSGSMQAFRDAQEADAFLTRQLKISNSELEGLQTTGPTSTWSKPLQLTLYRVTDTTIAEEFPQYKSEIMVVPASPSASSAATSSNASASSTVVTASGGAGGASSVHSTDVHACACNTSTCMHTSAGGGASRHSHAAGGSNSSTSGGATRPPPRYPPELQAFLDNGACFSCGSCNGSDEPPCRC